MRSQDGQPGGGGALIWRAVFLLVVFAGAGFATSHLVIAHAVAHGAREYDVRLAGLMAGLFAGGIAVVLAGLVMLLVSRSGRAGGDDAG